MVPIAIVLTLTIFASLAKLTSPGDVKLNKTLESPDLDFLLIRSESELELLSRRRPPPPEELQQIEEFDMQQPALSETLSVDIPNPNLEVPNIHVDMQIDMSPALAALSTSDLSSQMFAVDIPFQNNPKAMKDVRPRYPSRAQRKKIEGRLKAEFIVDANGYVKADSITFVEANPKGVFESSVIRSLKRSRFEVLMASGQPVAFRASKIYNFEMPK